VVSGQLSRHHVCYGGGSGDPQGVSVWVLIIQMKRELGDDKAMEWRCGEDGGEV
jgi:hypothetical protein